MTTPVSSFVKATASRKLTGKSGRKKWNEETRCPRVASSVLKLKLAQLPSTLLGSSLLQAHQTSLKHTWDSLAHFSLNIQPAIPVKYDVSERNSRSNCNPPRRLKLLFSITRSNWRFTSAQIDDKSSWIISHYRNKWGWNWTSDLRVPKSLSSSITAAPLPFS